MVNPFQGFLGLIIIIIAAGMFLLLFRSRTNAVEKTGYGSLIMLALISAMIPLFWIVEPNQEANAKQQQFADAVQQQGVALYAQYCGTCFTINNGKLVNPTYLGYSIDQINQMTDNQLMAVITSGVYNPSGPAPTNPNLIPKSQAFGGPLATDDIEYLFDFLRSADPAYLQKNGYSGDSAKNGFDLVIAYLQANLPNVYATASAPPPSNPNQFGTPVDMTSKQAVTITIIQPPSGETCTPACFSPLNVKIKVGTTITWVNKSSSSHTVTAIAGTNTSAAQAAPQIFDSKIGSPIATGGTFTWIVTMAAYNLNPTHVVFYYCQYHPTGMFAELTIVP